MRVRGRAGAAAVAIAMATVWGSAAPHEARAAALPQVSAGDVTIVEGHTGSRNAAVPITLDVPAPTTLTVAYTITAGTAAAGSDFKGAAGTVTFAAGTVAKNVNVTVYGDTLGEGDETVALALSAPSSGLAVADANGVVTILDDESTPGAVVSIGDVSVANGDNKVRSVTFPLTLSKPAVGTTVTYHLTPGSAAGAWSGSGNPPSGVDFGDKLGAVQSVSFTTAAVAKTIVVPIVADLTDEPDEWFSIVIDTVTGGGATAGRNGTGTIVDDDPALTSDPVFGASSTLVGTVGGGSTLVGCAQKDTRITATTSIHLDPSCTYTRGIAITASNVTVDCRGASIVKDPAYNQSHGILIQTDASVALHDVTVRNCNVANFGNNLQIMRQNFKTLAFGSEYVNGTSNIRVENNAFTNSTNSGVFVNAFVAGVTFTHNTVTGSGSVGVYLEAGSKDNVLDGNLVANNGYKDVIPGPASFTFGSTTIYYLSTGREGIAVDGSRNNVLRDNLVSGNSAGGIFLYKNCGEDASTAGHWVRNYGATGNVLRHNVITNQPNGVWVGSRAAENQYFMDCSDTPLVDNPGALQRVYLDPASGNTVEYNRFDGVTNAIRVEANGTVVQGNQITNGTRGVLLGSKYLTTVAATPIANSVITDNTTASVTTPYSWVWGKGTTTFARNIGNGGAGKLASGTQPTINPFLFVLSFV